MVKQKATRSEPVDEKKPQKRSRTKYQNPDPARETVESLVVAFILAFLFRTFEAEAFVIPTGSMAETLNGRHKEVDCEACGWHYHIGASQEVYDDSDLLRARFVTSICPNCRYENHIKDLPVFHGDRILVNKFSYELDDPRRWDVIVFKFPEQPIRNYIKRLVGLPNEFLKIERGDVYSRKSDTAEWEILRKQDPNKQRNLQMIVYDNDHPPRRLIANGWPECWAAVENRIDNNDDDGHRNDPAGWTADYEGRTFSIVRAKAAAGNPKWIRFRNYVPGRNDWDAVATEVPAPFADQPRPELVSDVCGYNMVSDRDPFRTDAERMPRFWVGDLALTCRIDVADPGASSAVTFQLTEGVRDYSCRIDLATGAAELSYFDRIFQTKNALGTAETDLKGAGSHRVEFANVDDRLCLWIDGSPVLFPDRGEYPPPDASTPTRRDLAPAGIGAEDAAVTVSHLRIERDIYYRADATEDPFEYSSMRQNNPNDPFRGEPLEDLLHDPAEYGRSYLQHAKAAEFPQLGPEEFFVLGDNSPQSNDSRLWTQTHSIPRSALLGKAFFIYWPHAIPFLNGGEGYPVTYHKSPGSRDEDYPKLRFPFYPNVRRMERIR